MAGNRSKKSVKNRSKFRQAKKARARRRYAKSHRKAPRGR